MWGERLYPILDTATVAARGLAPEDVARVWLDNSVRVLQLRHKGEWTAEVAETAARIAAMCRDTGAEFVINDRADMAAITGAAGVHLGQHDLRPSELTGALRREVIGWSTHNEAQLRESRDEPATYVALGPIFSTGSKENPDREVGVENLRRWRSLTARPLVAIGGITRFNAREVLDAGADCVAVIGDLFPDNDSVEGRIREWQVLLGS